MAFNTKENEIIKWGLANGKSKQEVEQAITNFRTGVIPPKPEVKEPNYLQRVNEDIKQGFGQAGSDIVTQDNRSSLSKGISAISNVASAVVSPLMEAPGFKQLGDLFTKGINLGGEQLAKLYSPEFKASLANMSDEEFNQATQPLQDLANAGNIANTILLAKGGQEVLKKAKEGVIKTKVELKKSLENTDKISEGLKNVAGEVIPTADRIVNEQVTKALQLTASDVKNIEASTGNVVGEFMGKNNLIGKNLVETQKLVKDFFKKNYDTVRTEISKVKTVYNPTKVPRYKQALTELKTQIEGVAGQEGKLNEINTLLKKKNVSLNDVQRVKELVDDTYNLYKVTGDVKEGVAKQGLDKIRKDLKLFIEKEVKTNTGTDISDLNNKVSTSKGISNASEARSTSGLTKSNFKIGDLAIFGAGSMIGSPLFGAALLIGKKIIESPAIRFRIAKWLDGVSDAQKLKLQEELSQGIAPKEIVEIVQSSPKIENIKAKTRAKTTISPKSTTSSLKVKDIPNKQGGFINLGEIAKLIDNSDKNIMLAFNEAVLAGKTPTKEIMLAAQKIADTMDLKSSTGTNKALANDFQQILDRSRELAKKNLKK